MFKLNKSGPALILVCFPVSGLAETGPEDPGPDYYSLSIDAGWESRYVTEGRDNLDGGGLQVTTIDGRYGACGVSVWNGWGYDSNYNEVNIVPYLDYKNEDISVYASYNYKMFSPSGQFDHEIGAGMSYQGLPHNLFLGFDWYHSFDAGGSFFSFFIGSGIPVDENLVLEPLVSLGVNHDYIADGHNGVNHLSLQLNGEYTITGTLSALAFVRYNSVIDPEPAQHPGDTTLRDFFWAGVAFCISF